MMQFFQKYQKVFFGLVSMMVVASFALFGVLDTFSIYTRAVRDEKVGEKLDGSPLMRLEVQALSRFIATDRFDELSSHPNLCNDGVIRNDFLQTGLAELIVSAYFESFQPDLEVRLKRAKNYRGYEHPEAPFICARRVWDQLAPALGQGLDALKQEETASVSTFSHFASLYAEERLCPAEFVKRALIYSHSQTPWVPVDAQLPYQDLALFGYHSLSDWFGSHFVDTIAQFILNSAAIAQTKGHVVSFEEAKADLYKNFVTSIQKRDDFRRRESLSMRDHLRSLGMSEQEAVQAWRSVLLFRRHFESVGNSVFLDPLLSKEFAKFSGESRLIKQFTWSPSLRLETFSDLIEFQVYLDSVSPPTEELTLPVHFFPLETVASKAPMLVQTGYRATVSKVTLEEIGFRASLNEIVNWQLNPMNWTLLMNECPFLEHGDSREARFQILEELSPFHRQKVDTFARLCWAKENVHLSEEMLSDMSGTAQSFLISPMWSCFEGITDPNRFMELLEASTLGETWAQTLLLNYSDQEGVIYRFETIEKVEEAHVLTFEEAKKEGVLALMADQLLESAYAKQQKRNPQKFQISEGKFKLFSAVKEEIAQIVFQDLLQKISSEPLPLEQYAHRRLEAASIYAIKALQKNMQDPNWIMGEDTTSLANQFRLKCTELIVRRNTKDPWLSSQVFLLAPGQWSSIYILNHASLAFFYVEKGMPSENLVEEQSHTRHKMMVYDAEKYVAKELLEQIQKKQAIVFPLHKEME